MNEQFKFPFKKREEAEEAEEKVFKGKMPTIEDDEALTIAEGGRLTSEEKNRQAAKKAIDTVLGRKEEKDKDEN